MNPDREQLKVCCQRVREAIQQVYDNGTISWALQFPKGWCGLASRVLGAFLIYNFPDQKFEYVCGESEKVGSHAWIEYHGIVLDVTADQFNDCKEPVIVEAYHNSLLHQSFPIRSQRLCSEKDIENNEESIIWHQLWEIMSDNKIKV